MAGLAFPDVGVFVSGADPNDPNTVDLWSANLAPSRTWRIPQAGRGRQYEQDQNRTGAGSVEWRNADEYLNPANPSSPLAVFVRPMRRTRMLASYPPAGTGNLLNSTAGQDPTFDTVPTGTLPAWLGPVGGTNPTVQAANPHSGANSLQYTVAGTNTPQGVTSLGPNNLQQLTFFPGAQYTASWWVRQSSASTQQATVGGLSALDRFQRSGAWSGSAAELGGVWAFTGGVSGDYTTTTGPSLPGVGTATISCGSVNVNRFITLPLAAQDYDLRHLVTIPVVAAGASIVSDTVGSFVDANNHYRFGLVGNTNGTVDARISKNVTGTFTVLATTTGAATYLAGSRFWVRAQKSGTTLNLKVWVAGTSEPAAWTVTTTDTALTAAGALGFIDVLTTGNTNTLPVVLTHQRLAVTSYTIVGTTTTATGTYTRLSVTFTAAQPTHTIAVTTVGLAVAGTVNLDDVQINPGATATANTATGPLVRGFWGGHVMDYPVTWEPGSQGFEGSVAAPLAGPFAALAQINIHTDYVTAVLALAPALYWPLWDGSGVTNFAEISGRGGPPLQVWSSPAGASSPLPTPGAVSGVVGDPSGTGVSFTQGIVGNPSDPGSALGTGSAFHTTPISFPASATGGQYGASGSLWVKATYPFTGGGATEAFLLKVATFQPTNSTQTGPFSLAIFNDGSIDAFFITTTGGIDVPGGATNAVNDGKWHHLVVTVTQVPAGNTTLSIYLDGQLYSSANTTTVAAGGLITGPVQNVMVGGRWDGVFASNFFGGTITQVALFDRALSTSEISSLYQAGAGHIGETSGARLSRYLGNYYTGPSIVDAAPMSKMGPPSAPEATPLLQAAQRIQDTEAGNLFENRDGAIQFDGREVRYLRTTASVVFGDGPGEIPYEEAPVFGYGLTQTNNQALITRNGGTRAVANPDTTGSVASYYARGYTLTVDCQTDLEAKDHADFVVASRGVVKQRVAKVRINLGANPALFPTIFSLDIGTRATFNRRPKAANAGAGITMTGDYFIENISHVQIDPSAATWFVDLEMSPVPLQPWILGDATYGQLGITTILGF